MPRAILIVLSLGLIASMAPAQPGPADEPSIVPTYGGRGQPSGISSAAGREYRLDPRPRTFVETQKLIAGWKTSRDGAEREKIEAELRGQLKREFAARLAVHEREIKQLEEKVRQLRQRLALRKEKQDEIVDHRLQQILRDAQGLGWGSEGTDRKSNFHYGEATDAAVPRSDDLFAAPSDNQSINELPPSEDVFGGEAPNGEAELAPK